MIPGIEFYEEGWTLRDAVLVQHIRDGEMCAMTELIARRTSLTEEEADELPLTMIPDVLEHISSAMVKSMFDAEVESAVDAVNELLQRDSD